MRFGCLGGSVQLNGQDSTVFHPGDVDELPLVE